eukprot:symbB.v1.2.005406.t1/scaffold316.1/size230253/21
MLGLGPCRGHDPWVLAWVLPCQTSFASTWRQQGQWLLNLVFSMGLHLFICRCNMQLTVVIGDRSLQMLLVLSRALDPWCMVHGHMALTGRWSSKRNRMVRWNQPGRPQLHKARWHPLQWGQPCWTLGKR